MRPRITAIRLINSDMAWTIKNVKPMTISDLAGHCGSPPALPDCSLISTERIKNGPPVMIMTTQSGSRKNSVTDDIDAVAHALGQHLIHDIDANVFVIQQRPG